MAADPTGKSVVLYDGVCGLCNATVQFLLRHDARGVLLFAALQSELAHQVLNRHGQRADDLDTVWVVADYGTPHERVLCRSRAALHCAGLLGWPWKLALVGRIVPAFVLDLGYKLIARYRYRLFGKSESCMMPQPGTRERFLA
jgi:predicted DCC family thiol-disulfide oxidoreductase YuxK